MRQLVELAVAASLVFSAGAMSCSSSSSGQKSCGSATVSGSGIFQSFHAAYATASNSAGDHVTVCVGNSTPPECTNSNTGALAICFISLGSSLQPGTYPVTQGGTPPVATSGDVEECMASSQGPISNPSFNGQNWQAVGGSVTYTSIGSTGGTIQGTASFQYASGDSVQLSFDAAVTDQGLCP
jgi:hypothetical protein